MTNWLKDWRSDLIFFVTVLACFTLFRSVAFAGYHIPSESMVPTLEVGDRIAVNKMAYGYSRFSVPFGLAPSVPTDDGRLFGRLPERGDIVVFRHTRDDVVMIKRVTGLPGDRLQMINGRLHVNGEAVPRTSSRAYAYRQHKGSVTRVQQYTEELPNGATHTIIERQDDNWSDNTPLFVVPEGHLFMMGDNRDNSSDSRVISHLGFVPVENLMGRAEIILFSTHRCREEAGLTCAPRRFFSKLD